MPAPVLANRNCAYVNNVGTDDAGYNLVGAPWSRRTIAAALADLLANYPAPSATNPSTISIGPGVYSLDSFLLPPWVWVTGSPDADSREPTIIQMTAGATIGPSVDWANNVTARGGFSNLVIRAAAGVPTIDFTMPVPTAGNPSRTIEVDNVTTDLDLVNFTATSTGDAFKINGLIHDGNLTNDFLVTGGAIIVQNVVSKATNTIGSRAGFAGLALLSGNYFATLALSQVTTALTVLSDVLSLATVANLSQVGAPVITYTTDANGLGYTPAVPGNWSPVPVTVQQGLDELAAGTAGHEGNGTAAVTNNAGNTTITPTKANWTERIAFTGAAGTRIAILAVTGAVAGDLIFLFGTRTDGGGIIGEVRNATAGGTLLATFPDNTGATTWIGVFVYGTVATGYAANAWVAQSFQIPATT